MEEKLALTTCRDLWNKWRNKDPDSPLVLQSISAMKKYSRDDWKQMSLEAENLIGELVFLVNNKIDVKDDLAKKTFFALLEHVKLWFFIPTKEYSDMLSLSILYDNDFRIFFDKYTPGLSGYMVRLIKEYGYTE